MRIPDTQLVEAARTGNHDAYTELVRRYRQAVYGLALHQTGEAAVAEDLTQDAFVQAYVRLGDLREAARFVPWVFAIARNLCRQRLRRPGPPTEELVAEPAVAGPEASLVEQNLVRGALAQLPEANGLALTLFYVDGYSYADIARFLELPVSTVKGRIERGRSHLREELQEAMEQLHDPTPDEVFTGNVIRRVSSAAVWHSRSPLETFHLNTPFLLIDGQFARRVPSVPGRGAVVRAARSLSSPDKTPFCVFQRLGSPNRFYVFGRGQLADGGPLFENTLVETTLSVTRLPEETLVAEPWTPEEVSTEELWGLPAAEREERLLQIAHSSRGGLVSFDGRPAEFLCSVSPGRQGGTITRGDEVFINNAGPGWLRVYHQGAPDARYLVFGEAAVTPPQGLTVSNEALHLQARLLRPIARATERRPPIPDFSSQQLFALSQAEQCALLGGHWAIRVDGRICLVKLTGGHGTDLTAESALTGEGVLFSPQRPHGRDRYYLFGSGKLLAPARDLANEALDVTVEAAAVPAEQPGEDAPEVPEWEGEQLLRAADRSALFAGLRPGSTLILDGALATCLAANLGSDESASSPGGEVTFRNTGSQPMTVLKWEYAPAWYFVFGEAQVSPPGFTARDAVVALEGKR